MARNLYCNVLGSSPNVQNLESKIFSKYCKRLVSKASCLVSVSARSSLGLVSSFCSKSRYRNANVSSWSRRFWSRHQVWLLGRPNPVLCIAVTFEKLVLQNLKIALIRMVISFIRSLSLPLVKKNRKNGERRKGRLFIENSRAVVG